MQTRIELDFVVAHTESKELLYTRLTAALLFLSLVVEEDSKHKCVEMWPSFGHFSGLFFLSLLARLTKRRERIDCSQYTNDCFTIFI